MARRKSGRNPDDANPSEEPKPNKRQSTKGDEKPQGKDKAEKAEKPARPSKLSKADKDDKTDKLKAGESKKSTKRDEDEDDDDREAVAAGLGKDEELGDDDPAVIGGDEDESESAGPARSSEPNEFVACVHAKNMADAERIRAFLEENDIPVIIEEEPSGRAKAASGIPVLVPDNRLEEAVDLLSDQQNAAKPDDADAVGDSATEFDDDEEDEDEDDEDEDEDEEEDEFGYESEAEEDDYFDDDDDDFYVDDDDEP